MFIDISTYVGHWPFRNVIHNTLDGLDRIAQANGITHMVVANIEGFFYKDANRANLTFLEEIKAYTGKTVFLPLAVVDPTYPEWERDARAMIEAGFKGFEISPRYHFYPFTATFPYDSYTPVNYGGLVLDLAAELDVPVRICTSVENYRARSRHDHYNNPTADELAALLSANKDAHVMITSFHGASVGGALGEVVKNRPNTYFDITALAAGAVNTLGCVGAMQHLDESQICYGSLAPIQYIEPTLIALEYDDALPAEKAKVNAARAFKDLR